MQKWNTNRFVKISEMKFDDFYHLKHSDYFLLHCYIPNISTNMLVSFFQVYHVELHIEWIQQSKFKSWTNLFVQHLNLDYRIHFSI